MKKRNLGPRYGSKKYIHNTCSFCNKSFVSIEDYENHIVSCQRCCLCNEKYSNKDDLWRHLESKHSIKKVSESLNVDKNTKNITKTNSKEVVINFSCPEPRLPPANSNQLSPIKRYGNTGCRGFERGIQNSKDFCPRINMPQGNY